MTCRSPSTRRPAATCALRTSEKAGDAIAKRPEREFSLGVVTAQISAEAVAGVLIRLLSQWIGYRTLAENFGEWQLFELPTGRPRHTAVVRPLTSGWLVSNKKRHSRPREISG